MTFSYFTPAQVIPLYISAVLLVASVALFGKKEKLSLLLLFAGAFGLGFFVAGLDHFLVLWDEQYHALVAKNLAHNFLKPVLYADPVLDYDYRNWTANHIWLHKQPLFLWQMALSIKLFGLSALAVRLPGVLMHALVALMIYRMGAIVISKRTGFFAALFFTVTWFPLELVAGRYPTDHNDVAFLFYVAGSFWTWFEYLRSRKKYWLLLTGLFSGCAVLVKWLMGLLVFVVWLITKIITDRENRFSIKTYLPMVWTAIVSLVVFLPWQIYISLAFPKEAVYEYRLASTHFFHAVEGHAETTWYYFNNGLGKLYGDGDLMPFVLLAGLVFLLIRIPDKVFRTAIAVAVIFVYGFYTLAATKMTAFPIIVSPFVFLGLGFLIDALIRFLKQKLRVKWLVRILPVIIPLMVAWPLLNLQRIQRYHTYAVPHDNHNRLGEQTEMHLIHTLNDKLGRDDYVIFNASVTLNGHIPVMFYTGYTAYGFIPTREQIEKVRQANRKIAVIDTGNLPGYITNDPRIKIVKVEWLQVPEKGR